MFDSQGLSPYLSPLFAPFPHEAQEIHVDGEGQQEGLPGRVL